MPTKTAAGGESSGATAPPAIASTTSTWSVAGGSLANSVTFESFHSYGDDDRRYSPLVLYPPSPSPPSCDITITFSGKQRVLNVNLRSTARVYEIYCTPELGSSSEYLCSLLCVALRDKRVLRSTGVVEDEGFDDGKSSGSGGDLSGNEDDWVEVKSHHPPQYLYEATVEIMDANPCTSMTLKLLSLHDEGHVHVDEIYVYADPVDTVKNPDNRVTSMGSAAAFSVMKMPEPGYFELYKAKDVGRAQVKCSIDTGETQKSEEVASEATDTVNVASEVTDSVNVASEATDTVNVASEIPQVSSLKEADPNLVQMPQVSGTEEGKQDMCCSQTERELILLSYRVSKAFRFQESMLKPIHSINERLQRLEDQVEVLTKKPEISAPDSSSCSDSESESFDIGNRHPAYKSDEANKKVSPSNVLPISIDESPALMNATALHPGLVTTKPYPGMVFSAPEFPSSDTFLANSPKLHPGHPGLVFTAPEFSNCDDDEEEHQVEEPVNGSSPGPKQEHSLAHAIKSPELPNVEDDSNDKAGSQRVHFAMPSDPSTSIGEPDGIENHPPESVKASPKQNQKHSLSMGALARFLASLMGQEYSEARKPSENNNGEEEHSQTTAVHSSSIFDLETQTLDVQSLSLLESSLDGMQDWNEEVSSGEESCDGQINLLSAEDWEAFTSVSDDLYDVPVDTNYYNVVDWPMHVEAAELLKQKP